MRGGDLVPRRSNALPEQTPVFDVLTVGRIGVDLYPLEVGVSLREASRLGKFLGGSPTNVAVAAARLGRRSAVISGTGTDPFGDFVRDALRAYCVDDRYVISVPELPTPLTFCEMFPPDTFPLYFYRQPTAPDLQVSPNDLDYDAIRAARILWVSVSALCQEPSRSAVLSALEARAKSGTTILDLDYRPMFWRSREEARSWVERALAHVTVAVGNLDECETAVGSRTPAHAARALRAHGVGLAIVKQGPQGVLADDGRSIVQLPPVPVEVVNGLGAGDAFGGALCHGLLERWGLHRLMRFCSAAGALVASRIACSAAMPTDSEIQSILTEAGHGR